MSKKKRFTEELIYYILVLQESIIGRREIKLIMYFGESNIILKSDISVLENNFLVALQDFDNFNTSIRIFKESGIILESEQEEKTKKTLIEKIKELWYRFKEWIKGIWEKIKGLFRKKNSRRKRN